MVNYSHSKRLLEKPRFWLLHAFFNGGSDGQLKQLDNEVSAIYRKGMPIQKPY